MPSVPKRRDMARQPPGLADGDADGVRPEVLPATGGGDGGIDTVTATRSGLALTSATPAGRSVVTATDVVPGSRSATSSVARRVVPWSRSRSATEPPSVMSTRSVEVLYLRS